MTLPPILTHAKDLAPLADELRREAVIAVDLEADSMHSYRDKVCLIQFTTSQRDVLVDPLACGDLSALKPIFADPGIRKIFHAGDYDIRSLHRDFGIEVIGLFDTMICSQFLGEERIGLADVLGKYFSIELDKKFQKADWSKRPLSPEMIAYAAEDTRHLHQLAILLEEKINALDRLEWVKEEFALLEKVRHSESDGPLFLRIKGAALLDPLALAILEELLLWRNEVAQRRDTPVFKVFGNAPLLQIARNAPRSLQGLVGIEGVSPRHVDRYGRQILQAVERGLALPEAQRPRYPRPPRREKDPAADKRLTKLKGWRKEMAESLNMDPGIVINNALLEEISRRAPQTSEQLAQVPMLKRWQQKILGIGILQTLNGK
ncbi:MAG: ribonuclease D [Desulfuromonas sp.]|nr:MAG: ribonuclease D [Desulfuromonas sp.]